MFRLRWLRRMVRRHTNPIEEERAIKWQRRLSLTYMIVATNAFIACTYMCFTGRADWADYYGFKSPEDKEIPSGVVWAKTLGMENVKVIKISGFKKVDEYDVVNYEKVRSNTVQEKSE
uniref:Uncharacterized protein n=1 Tax=Xenopsylla cheopis TaxID=163159 RepID=A0A6M2DEC7_XENCH